MLIRMQTHPGGRPGMHFLYRTEPAVCAPCVERALQAAWGGRLSAWTSIVEGRELRRVVLPGEVEFRFAQGDSSIALLHRAEASEPARERNRTRFEGALRALVAQVDERVDLCFHRAA